jgi:hypothetical protein
MNDRSTNAEPLFPLMPALAIAVVVILCSAWTSLAYTVTEPASFKYFPPFEAGRNDNASDHLGGEYFCIAKALAAGQGFANPFYEPTGPTAWMPPLLPLLHAALLWVSGGSRDVVTAAAVLFQVLALVLTGYLVVALTARFATRLGAAFAAVIYVVTIANDFHSWFQFTHDYALILLTVDALVYGLVWGQPLASRKSASAWGVFGGVCALVNPILGGVWGVLSAAPALRQRRFVPLAFAFLTAGLTLTPWTVRNLLLFGKLIPVKSNAAYELYQSQCLQADGLIRGTTFATHPYATNGPERQEYIAIGETKFLEHKMDLFWRSVLADPLDFCDRVACRFFGVTLWYVPGHRDDVTKRPWRVLLCRVVYPLPFLGVLVLALTAFLRPWTRAESVIVGVYVLYLLPYVLVSYYDRYGLPMLGVKTLLVVFGADRLVALIAGARQRKTAPGAEVAVEPPELSPLLSEK